MNYFHILAITNICAYLIVIIDYDNITTNSVLKTRYYIESTRKGKHNYKVTNYNVKQANFLLFGLVKLVANQAKIKSTNSFCL